MLDSAEVSEGEKDKMARQTRVRGFLRKVPGRRMQVRVKPQLRKMPRRMPRRRR